MKTKLFLMRDRMDETPRWIVGELRANPSGDSVHLASGKICPFHAVSARIIHVGPELEYSHNSFGVPIVAASLAEMLIRVAAADVQLIPLSVEGSSGHWALNVLRTVRCVDEDRSIYKKWTLADHRADLEGQYHYIYKLIVDGAKVPDGAHIFRIWGWEVALIVSETMKQAMEAAGCHGAVFVPVELS